MYEQLLGLYQRIKNIEHAERLMTDYAGRYKKMPTDINQKGEAAKIMKAENELTFTKFKVFAEDRTYILRSVASSSAEIVQLINNQLGAEKTKEVDIDLFKVYLEEGSETAVLEKFIERFPQYTIDEVKKELDTIKK
jgi:hypothetical protein